MESSALGSAIFFSLLFIIVMIIVCCWVGYTLRSFQDQLNTEVLRRRDSYAKIVAAHQATPSAFGEANQRIEAISYVLGVYHGQAHQRMSNCGCGWRMYESAAFQQGALDGAKLDQVKTATTTNNITYVVTNEKTANAKRLDDFLATMVKRVGNTGDCPNSGQRGEYHNCGTFVEHKLGTQMSCDICLNWCLYLEHRGVTCGSMGFWPRRSACSGCPEHPTGTR